MAGRGKTSSIIQIASALHVERNEIKSQPQSLQPIPIYPPKELCQVPLVEENDFYSPLDYDYIWQAQTDCLTAFKEGPFHLEPDGVKRDIERYTDRLRRPPTTSFEPDWSRLPRELQPLKKRKLGEAAQKRQKKVNPLNFDALERREAEESGEKDTKAEGSGDSEAEEEEDGLEAKKKEIPVDDEVVQEEEEDEEFTDYANNYFDNGEEYAEDSAEDNPDEATY